MRAPISSQSGAAFEAAAAARPAAAGSAAARSSAARSDAGIAGPERPPRCADPVGVRLGRDDGQAELERERERSGRAAVGARDHRRVGGSVQLGHAVVRDVLEQRHDPAVGRGGACHRCRGRRVDGRAGDDQRGVAGRRRERVEQDAEPLVGAHVPEAEEDEGVAGDPELGADG